MSQSAADELVLPSPFFLYGTAWKEEQTARLTEQALRQGFRGVDTANQRKHYHEAGVGQGIAAAIKAGVVTRSELFLQTKFTFVAGQDQRLPYDPAAPIRDQVAQSFTSSLDHLGTTYLDAYVLHGPMYRAGLATEDWEAWRAMEELCQAGRTRSLGVSNVSLEQLQMLCRSAQVRPRFVQNRCFAVLGWDHAVREFCRAEGIVYQGFSLLTANPQVLQHVGLQRLTERYGKTPAQIVFRFALDIGMLPLTGTTDPAHMAADLAACEFSLDQAEVAALETIAVR